MFYADNHCTYTEAYQPEHTYTFTGKCVMTGKPYSVTVKAEELWAYRNGAYIQDAFKSLSPEDREFLKSGFSPEGWNEAFSDDECETLADDLDRSEVDQDS